MGTDWRHHGHPLSDSRPYPTTLPSVAELLSSRPPAVDPAYHRMPDSVPPAPVHRPVVSHLTTSPAATNSTTVQRTWTSANHPTPNVSPTDTRILATAPEPPHNSTQDPRQTAPSFTSTVTSEASPSVTDAAYPQRPINCQRQDSAISQQRIETLKEAGSVPPSSDITFSSSTQQPDHTHTHPSTNTRPSSQPSSPASTPTTVERRPSLAFTLSDPKPLQQGHSKSLSLGGHAPADASRTQERMVGLTAPIRSDPAPKSTGPVSPLDQANSTTTRQQRYNVRFIANYTSENMPLSQKPRNDTVPVVPALAEVTEPPIASPEQPLTPSVEPSIPPTAPVAPPADDQLQVQPRRRDASVERCLGCNEPWKRPLPNTEMYRQSSPAENNNDLSKFSMNIIAQLVDHRKKADAMYERWRWRHSHCLPLAADDDDLHQLQPPTLEPQNDSHASNGEGALHDSKSSDTPSNKRKSEIPHDDAQQSNSKVRKVTFDAQSNEGPTPPSAPA